MVRFRFSVVVSAALVLSTATVAFAAAGDVDAGFGTLGHATFDFPDLDRVAGVDRQSNGKIVVAGDNGGNWFQVTRFSADGVSDGTFGSGGYRTIQITGTADATARDLAIQANDKILVAGYMLSGGTDTMVLARFRAGGAPDTSFGTAGLRKVGFKNADAYSYAVTVQPDGKIVLAGERDPKASDGVSQVAVVRLRADGSLDPTFGSGGRKVIDVPDHYAGYNYAE